MWPVSERGAGQARAGVGVRGRGAPTHPGAGQHHAIGAGRGHRAQPGDAGAAARAADGSRAGGDGVVAVDRRPPAAPLRVQPAAGVILGADLGATHGTIAVADLAGSRTASHAVELPIADGPEHVLTEVLAHFDALLAASGTRAGRRVGNWRGRPRTRRLRERPAGTPADHAGLGRASTSAAGSPSTYPGRCWSTTT